MGVGPCEIRRTATSIVSAVPPRSATIARIIENADQCLCRIVLCPESPCFCKELTDEPAESRQDHGNLEAQ
jgi:hypothetical protein